MNNKKYSNTDILSTACHVQPIWILVTGFVVMTNSKCRLLSSMK